MHKIILAAALIILLYSGVSFADHPLITDGAETLDKGEFVAEINSEFSFDKKKVGGISIKEREAEIAALITSGVMDNVEIVLELPYRWIREKENGENRFSADGIGDAGLGVKWRFYRNDNLHLALKPSISLPTGSAKKGLGNGRISYGLMFLATREMEPFQLTFHLNIGYMHNEYKLREDREENRKDLWHVSLAAEKAISENLSAVANIGIERNVEKGSSTHPAFILGGLIYSISRNLNVDFGIKGGITKTEPDIAYLAGIVWSF